MLSRYSRWDGSQSVPDFDADDLLSAMADDLMAEGDPWSALRRLLRQGMRDPQGGKLPGIQELLDRLRQRRQRQLERYDLGSAFEDIERKLQEIIQTERTGMERQVAEARAQAERKETTAAARRATEERAARQAKALDRLPPDAAGRLRQLQEYDFMDAEAKERFEELLNSLRQQMLQPFMSGMQQALQNMKPEDLRKLREMIQDLNRMLRQRAQGDEPDFDAFRQKWGEQFPGAESLDDVIEQLRRQSAQMQSLLASLSPDQRRQLQDMMRSLLLRDERLEAALAQLSASLEQAVPWEQLRRRYDFQGDEDLTLEEAMRVLDELRELDRLERDLKGVQSPADLEQIDPARVEELLGDDAARDLDQLRDLAKKLEEAGYLERKGDRLELTARAIRKIADKALRDIFAHLKRDRFGGHVLDRAGGGGDRTDDVKPYEFGDAFLLDLRETLMNAVVRGGAGLPVRLAPADFAVYRTELATQSSTVVMLDMSRSMIMNGCWVPAKKVALALNALIRGQFPRDALHIVGFSLHAREFNAEDLPALTWSDSAIGTNMHAGFALARQLLGRRAGSRQIVMITDGEPTAHLEGGQAEFAYPPTLRTLQETLKEVQRCTRAGITINTFMLDRSPSLTAFVEQMTRINRGRAFFATPERLGEYLLVDYVRAKRRSA